MTDAVSARRPSNGKAAAPIFGVLLSALVGCDRAPEVVQHPTARNEPPADAALLVPTDVPVGLSPDRLAAWTVARQSFRNATPLYRLGALTGDGPEVFGRIDDVVLDNDNFDPQALAFYLALATLEK